MELVREQMADWDDPATQKRLYMRHERFIPKPIFPWAVKQSGYAGPLVMQLIT